MKPSDKYHLKKKLNSFFDFILDSTYNLALLCLGSFVLITCFIFWGNLGLIYPELSESIQKLIRTVGIILTLGFLAKLISMLRKEIKK